MSSKPRLTVSSVRGPSIFQKELAGLPLKERMKEMRKPDVKERILAVDNSLWGKPFAAVIWNPGNLYHVFRTWCGV